jgi:hypothetical protein
LPEILRPARGRVEEAVHPDECLAAVHLVRWRVAAVWQASMKVPGHEQRYAVGVLVGETAAVITHDEVVPSPRRDSQVGSAPSAETSLGAAGRRACATHPLEAR